MKLAFKVIELYIKLMVYIIQGFAAVAQSVCCLIGGLISVGIRSRQLERQQQQRQLQAAQEAQQKELAKQEVATRKAEIAQSLGCAYSAEVENQMAYGNALECKAACEKDPVKRHKLMLQAVTAYRRAEQLASKCPDYVRP